MGNLELNYPNSPASDRLVDADVLLRRGPDEEEDDEDEEDNGSEDDDDDEPPLTTLALSVGSKESVTYFVIGL